MSKSKKTQDRAETQEKVVTRYDLKMQRRREQKIKEAREKRIASVIGVVLLAGLICLLLSFPIRSWLMIHGTYIEVAGEKVSRLEFDYNFNLVKNNYVAQNSMYFSYLGIDLSGDLSQKMFSETLSWKDFFDEMAVDNIRQTKALQKEMRAAGFSYDATEQYEQYKESLKQSAADSGVTVDSYVKQLFGSYATMSRIESFVKTGMETKAYYDSVSESKTPTDEEIMAYYNENKDSYDCVDYRLLTVYAELPTEPTDPTAVEPESTDDAESVDETGSVDDAESANEAETVDEAETTDETGETVAEEDTESVYEPTEAEIQAAMATAKEEADAKLETVAEEGELYEKAQQADAPYLLREWLFDSARAAGDTTVIEDAANNEYYVVAFVDRYVDQTPTVDTRMVITMGGNGQEIVDEWMAGEATEESFAALADKYSESMVMNTEGGLYEGLSPSAMLEEMTTWLSDGARKKGDTTVITPAESGVTYVIYYIGTNDPEWKILIKDTLLSEKMEEYIDTIKEGIEVNDPKKNLYYLEVQAMEEAAAQSGTGDAAEDSSATESSSAE